MTFTLTRMTTPTRIAAAFLLTSAVVVVAGTLPDHTEPAPSVVAFCAPLAFESQGEWDALLAMGWRGRADDGTDDLLYAPGCY